MKIAEELFRRRIKRFSDHEYKYVRCGLMSFNCATGLGTALTLIAIISTHFVPIYRSF